MKSTVGDVKGAKPKAAMPISDKMASMGQGAQGTPKKSVMPEKNTKAQGIAKPDTIKKPGAVGKKSGLRDMI